jgi:hypothetical protein
MTDMINLDPETLVFDDMSTIWVGFLSFSLNYTNQKLGKVISVLYVDSVARTSQLSLAFGSRQTLFRFSLWIEA